MVAICGAAVVAIAPQVKAKDDETAVAIIAILGTIFTLIYVIISSAWPISIWLVYSQGHAHEIAHVIARQEEVQL